jgi:hypothetical protein
MLRQFDGWEQNFHNNPLTEVTFAFNAIDGMVLASDFTVAIDPFDLENILKSDIGIERREEPHSGRIIVCQRMRRDSSTEGR